jgi:hypothetical protein
MTNTLIIVAIAVAGLYLLRRALRDTPLARFRSGHAGRGIDVGPVSTGWIAEHRSEEPR